MSTGNSRSTGNSGSSRSPQSPASTASLTSTANPANPAGTTSAGSTGSPTSAGSSASLRTGTARDLDALAAIDPLLAEDSWRRSLVRNALASGACVVADADGSPAGYATADHGFYGRGWVHLVHVAATHRRRGLGDALLAACEARCRAAALFVSTNESNAPMRALLERRGYLESGVVEGLDEGDPEVFYRKPLAPRSA